jgi:hypothetical protein
MTKSANFVACVGVLCLSVASAALAEPITVTAGSLVFPTGEQGQGGVLSLIGTRGFSLNGFVNSGETLIAPLKEIPIVPDSTMSLRALLFGFAFVGVDATFDGHSYPNIGGVQSDVLAVIDIVGTLAVPAVREPLITLTAPFTLHASFFQPLPELSVAVRGGGVATLTMAPNGSREFWELRSLRYDFVETPVPEPATLLLVAGGLAGLVRRARRRRESSIGG